MACDSLIAAEVVVPSGADGAKAIRADLENNSDLLWALRGAGNGNFGIVTSLTYRMYPLNSVAIVRAKWRASTTCKGSSTPGSSTAPTTDGRSGAPSGRDHETEICCSRSGRGRRRPGSCWLRSCRSGTPDVSRRGRQLGRHLRRDSRSGGQPRRAGGTGSSSRSSSRAVPGGGDRSGCLVHAAAAPIGGERLLRRASAGRSTEPPPGGTAFSTATRCSTPSRARLGTRERPGVATRSRPGPRPG